MAQPKKTTLPPEQSYLERIENEVNSNQSRISLVLGALILIVAAFLLFNYFSKAKPEIGPAQQTPAQMTEDVLPEQLPGKYTVKNGDTLFTIAEKYYQDGFKYTEIQKVNNLTDPNTVEVGQVLEIPKLETAMAEASPTATPTTTPTPTITPTPSPAVSPSPTPMATPVVTPQVAPTIDYGPAITGNTYTVVEGDWLSTIAARAYKGDIMAYPKIAQANKIPNPDYILPGMVLTIPR